MVRSKSSRRSDFFLFEDSCCYTKSGNKLHGPSLFCYLFIFLQIVVLISHLVHTISIRDKFKGKISDLRYIGSVVWYTLFSIFIIMFIYRMCYSCNFLIGFIMLILINIIHQYIFAHLNPVFWSIDMGDKRKIIEENVPTSTCNCK